MKKLRLLPTIPVLAALFFAALAYWAYQDFTRVESQRMSRTCRGCRRRPRIFPTTGHSWTAYEFDITEEDFVALAHSEAWALRTIKQEPAFVHRHGFARLPLPDRSPPENPTKDQLLAWETQRAAYAQATEKIITDGYSYVGRHPKRGGGIALGYDSRLKRAYVSVSAR